MKRLLANIRRFFRRNRKECTFFIVFIFIFIAAQSLYYFSRPLKVPFYIQITNARLSSVVINLITPKEETFIDGKNIKSGGFSLGIAWGCEGVEGIFLIVAALTAYSIKRKWKLYGILAGTVFLYAMNIFRIIFLYYIVKYNPTLFDIMHVYVGQTFIIFFGVLFFVTWIYAFSNR